MSARAEQFASVRRPAYLTSERAAEISGRSRDRLVKSLQAGELHGMQRIKRGRWTIREDCLEAWLAGEPCEHQEREAAARSNVVAFRGPSGRSA